ncbi:helix-turn-helix domain-containing protein [Pseudaquidulcibacter saccharophilus]|uniref:helix-turn-helix domain-containing protein n=1 Tax=Pseudaquidulcibacter saccharophilus TaxID=2831900 RepID=UPI001EFF15B6|nr:helix-turn-helix domain-containing protein [Pseudaquidulcibacter saccharophilus]
MNNRISQKEKIAEVEKDMAIVRIVSEIVAFSTGIKDDLIAPTRGTPQNAFARQMAMYLTHVGFGISINRVASAFGRDRTTVSYACNLIEDKRDEADFDNYLDNIERLLNEIPPAANIKN